MADRDIEQAADQAAEDDLCPTCLGARFLLRDIGHNYFPKALRRILCPTCDGTGKAKP